MQTAQDIIDRIEIRLQIATERRDFHLKERELARDNQIHAYDYHNQEYLKQALIVSELDTLLQSVK